MEGLLLILFAFVEVFLGAVAGILLSLLSLVGTLTQLALGLVSRGQSSSARSDRNLVAAGATKSETPTAQTPVRLPVWIRRSFRYISLAFTVFFGVLVFLNAFFFEPTVENVAGYVLKKNRIEFGHDGMEGNLFTGQIKIAGLRAKTDSWAIKMDSVDVNVAVSSLLLRSKRIESLLIDGFQGEATMDRPSTRSERPPTGGATKGRMRHWLAIDELAVKNAEIQMTFADGGQPPIHSVRIDSLQSDGFRSRWALFYLFFRSNLQGELNGTPLVVSVGDRVPAGKTTHWKIEDLPLQSLAASGGAFDWFESGEVSIDVTDDWTQGDHLEVELDWNLTFSNTTATAPNASIIRKAIVNHFNQVAEPVEISFQLQLDPETFEGSSSESANALYSSVSAAVVKKIVDSTGLREESVEMGKRGLVEGVQRALDRARRVKE